MIEPDSNHNTTPRPPLLLFCSRYARPGLGPAAATLAWMAREAGHLFDLYFDAFHRANHYGGDARHPSEGDLTGGAVVSGRHVEQLHYLHARTGLKAVILGDSFLRLTLEDLGVPILAQADGVVDLYQQAAAALGLESSPRWCVVGDRDQADVFAYPDIYRRRLWAVGLTEWQQAGERPGTEALRGLFLDTSEVRDCACDSIIQSRSDAETIGQLTRRAAEQHLDDTGGWIVADPAAVLHWIPTACEDGLVPLYSEPMSESIEFLAQHRGIGHSAVLGRQSTDADFFALSRAGRSLQVIDPNRPPFQSVRHLRRPIVKVASDGNTRTDPSDGELEQWADEGAVLSTVFFWSGAIREVENFYGILDLVARRRFRCGLVVCGQTPEYMPHEPFSLIGVPPERGGVAGLVELVLGSAGMGIAIEAEMPEAALVAGLTEALGRLRERMPEEFLPTGWWVTMDAPLVEGEAPSPVQYYTDPPHWRLRYAKKNRQSDHRASSPPSAVNNTPATRTISGGLKAWMQSRGLDRYFEPWRPFEKMRPGQLPPGIPASCGQARLRYWFSKTKFAVGHPAIVHLDEHVIGLNTTTGQWDGWTPFETINHVRDLERAEKALLRTGRPGWLAGTLDACLWTFGGHLLERGTQLEKIAHFFAEGGRSGKLKNVRPAVVARYGRLLARRGVRG